MNQSRFNGKLFYTAVLFLLCSCGGNEEKTKTEPAADTTATTTEVAPAAPVSTISTTPQLMLLVRHKVADFAKWKAAYEAHDSMRLANGLHNYVIGRSVADSNVVLLALKGDDLAKAKAFSKSADLKQTMQKAGVVGTPTVMFMTAIFQDSAIIPSTLRAMNIMTVKDRDVWYTKFQEGKQERLDNGIVERVVAQDADNDKKAILVTAIMDTAKANAYLVSDALKKRRETGGVVGMPERFVFQIVKRY